MSTPILRRLHAWARGFSLIELMLALGIGAIMSSAMWGSVYYQNLMFMQRSDEEDMHARANATLAYLGYQIRQAGSGMPFDGSSQGLAAVGPCTKTPGTLPAQVQNTCMNLDGSPKVSDRLRIVYGLSPSTATLTPSLAASAAYCNGLPTQTFNLLHYQAPATGSTPYLPSTNDYVVVSGSCQSATTTASDAVKITSVSKPPTTSGCTELGFSNVATGLPALSCTYGYQSSYTFAPLVSTDFYLAANSDPSLPTVLYQDLVYGSQRITQQVAPGISRFQVRYGIDTTTPVDGRLDLCPSCTQDPYSNVYGQVSSWCRDPRGTDLGGPCNLQDSTGTQLSTAQIYNRIIAVYVEIDVQRNNIRANAQGTGQAAQITRTYRRLYTIKSRA